MKKFIFALAALGIALSSMSITVPGQAKPGDYGNQNYVAEGGN